MATGLCLDEKVFQFLDTILDAVGEKEEAGRGEVDRFGVASFCGLSCLLFTLFPLPPSVLHRWGFSGSYRDVTLTYKGRKSKEMQGRKVAADLCTTYTGLEGREKRQGKF